MQPGRILLSCAVLVVLGMPAAAAPDEDLLGKAAGYPIGSGANWFYDESVRVGSFSHLDSILPHYTLKKAAHAGLGCGAARLPDARGRAGEPLSLCVQSDGGTDATDWHRQPEAFTPRKATPYFGYGYQFWLFPSEKRRFALLGVYGQSSSSIPNSSW
ncbi:hypothetical protein [Bradyrhizobium paxllaeri]|uniref:hypothetical protein n=1 Tax=Bradyrhizobium paxllaeri TaxID=190148 RepID=UPI000810B97C|nr:hypothetical protein [Bradyrhizobium paxllaeri]